MSQELPNQVESRPAVVEPSAAPGASSVTPGPVKARAAISNRALNVLLGGALVLAVAGVAFAAGRMTAPAPTITAGAFPGGNLPGGGTFNGQGNGQGRPGGANGGVGMFGSGGATIEGTVESVSDSTITLKTADGQTIQIALDDSTTYHAQSDASADDVVTGSKVLVRLDFLRGNGPVGPQATAGTGGTLGGLTADDVTVVP